MSTIELVTAIENRITVIANDEMPQGERRQAWTDISSFVAQLLNHGEDLATAQPDAVVAAAADAAQGNRIVAFMLLRILPLPAATSFGESSIDVSRNIVAAVEKFLPEVCTFLRTADLRQTHEKLEKLSQYHPLTISHIAPFSQLGDSLDAVIAFRQTAMSVIRNGKFKPYMEKFFPDDLATFFETSFKKLTEFNTCSPRDFSELLLDAVSFFESSLAEFTDLSTFITRQTVEPFCVISLKALKDVEASSKGRFVTSIDTSHSQKRYPLKDVGHTFRLRLPFNCLGPGSAFNTIVTILPPDDLYLPTTEIEMGQINPGEFSAVFEVLVIKQSSNASILVQMQWSEIGEPSRKTRSGSFNIIAQQSDKDWAQLQYERPYSTEPATGSAFVGRHDRVVRVANHMLRNPLVSFYITGQKRVGKTSLAIAAADFAKNTQFGNVVKYIYLQWGSFAYEDPRESLRHLGIQLGEFLSDYIEDGEALLASMSFDGSLSPLSRMSTLLQQQCPGEKFVFMLDEFDELHPELYRQGRLAETFFANLRALSTTGNIGFVLIGGENMPFVMDRQGQKLNKFIREPLDYYSRGSEWDDYVGLIREPTAGKLTWHDDAIAAIYNATRGNPFFSNIVCGGVYTTAISERDEDVTAYEVERSLAREISGFDVNSFAHLWQDGASNLEAGIAEVEVLKRSRTLVAIGRAMRQREPLTIENITKHNYSAALQDHEISTLLSDFCRREVLIERQRQYEFALPLFGQWLVQSGLNRLIADTLGDELAAEAQAADDRAFVTLSEIDKLVSSWSLYQGKEVTVDKVRIWLQQVGSIRHQRFLFTILSNTRFFTEVEVRELLKTAHTMVLPDLPLFVRKKQSDVRSDTLLTYIDGEGKSGQYYASRYAEVNKISQQGVFNAQNFSSFIAARIAEGITTSSLIIVDDLIATGRSISGNLTSFIEAHRELLRHYNISVFVVAICSTVEGEHYLRTALGKISSINVDLRICETLERRFQPFHLDSGLWASVHEADEARALCTDIGARIYRKQPLGFGQLGLSVVFPLTVPNNSLPILHSANKTGERWVPLFPRLTN